MLPDGEQDEGGAPPARLDSWKQIAAYLDRDVRTVRRWEKSEGLPVRRHFHRKQASVFAWQHEIDGWLEWRREGSVLEPQADEVVALPPSRTRALPALLSALALAVAVGFAWWWLGDAPSVRTIAVLPMATFSADPEDRELADGLTEALITDLAGIDALRVISRTSVVRYRDTELAIPQIARELGADAVVEGAIVRDGDRVRITAQLIEGATDIHLWADSYEGDIDDVLELQRRVAKAVATEIDVTLNPEDRARLERAVAVHPEAYRLYVRGRFHLAARTPAGLRRGLDELAESVRIDPGYAPAHAALADAYHLSAEYRVLAPAGALPLAEMSVARALELDPELGEAHLAVGAMRQAQWRWQEADVAFRRAVALSPGSSSAHQWYGEHLMLRGRHEEALVEIREALRLDPASLIVNAVLGAAYLFARRPDEAISQLEHTLRLDPEFAVAHEMLGRAWEQKGDHAAAMASFREAARLTDGSPEYLAALARGHAAAGEVDEARRLLADLEAHSASVSAFEIALVYGALGETDRAFAWLERAYEERSTWLAYLAIGPTLDPLRTDPRFAELQRRVGIPDR